MATATKTEPQTYYSRCDNFSIGIEQPIIAWDNGRKVCTNEDTLTAQFETIAPGAGSKYTTDDPNRIKVLDAKCRPEAPESRYIAKAAFPVIKSRQVNGFEG